MRYVIVAAVFSTIGCGDGYVDTCPECEQVETPKPGTLRGYCDRTPRKMYHQDEETVIVPMGKICMGSIEDVTRGTCYVSDPLDEKPFGRIEATSDVYCVAETPTAYLIERL